MDLRGDPERARNGKRGTVGLRGQRAQDVDRIHISWDATGCVVERRAHRVGHEINWTAGVCEIVLALEDLCLTD